MSNRNNNYLKWLIPTVLIIIILILIFGTTQDKNEVIINSEESLIEKEIDTTSFQSFSKIAVLPFLNSKLDQNSDYLGFAIADQVIEELSYLKNITVRPSSSIRKYEKRDVESSTAAEELNVDYLITGEYILERSIFQLKIDLVEVETNINKWHDKIELEFKSIYELQDIVAKNVASNINMDLIQEKPFRVNKDIPSNPLAYEYYLKGISYPYSLDGNIRAKELLEKSVELDSSYAQAISQLADRVYRVSFFGIPDSTKYRSVENLYLKALSLNNDLISAKKGLARYYLENGRVEESLNLSKQLLEDHPNNMDALISMGYVLRYTGLDRESILLMEKARAIDPRNQKIRSLSLSYAFLGEYDQALEVYDSLEKSDWIIGMSAYILAKQRKYKKSLELHTLLVENHPNTFEGMISAVEKAILENDTLKGIQGLINLEQMNIIDPEYNFYRACNYALLGDKESSIRILNSVIEGGFFNYPLFISESSFESLRNDPEFQELMERAKIKHESFKDKYITNKSG